jgi:hypothetical protein
MAPSLPKQTPTINASQLCSRSIGRIISSNLATPTDNNREAVQSGIEKDELAGRRAAEALGRGAVQGWLALKIVISDFLDAVVQCLPFVYLHE